MANNARIPNIQALIAAGMDPKTGLPIKMSNSDEALKANIKKLLRIKDEQDAINRFVWHNLPSGLTGQLLERILYYKGQGCMFYIKENNTFYFLPYTLRAPAGNTGLDVYGRFTGVSPLVFNGSSESKKDREFIPGMLRIPQYEVVIPENYTDNIGENGCVLLADYSNQISQTNISRQILNDPLLDVMSDCIPYMHTALMGEAGVSGMRVESQDEASNVAAASLALNNAALTGKKWVPVVGHTEFQDLTTTPVGKSEDFLLSMQSLDNFRLGLYGLATGGVFEKKGTTLQSENDINSANTSLSMQDCLTNRQRFCDIVNSIWGIGIWCEQSMLNTDYNMMGMPMQDEQDQSGTQPGENSPEEVGNYD